MKTTRSSSTIYRARAGSADWVFVRRPDGRGGAFVWTGPGGRDGPQKLPLQANGTAVRQRGRRRGKNARKTGRMPRLRAAVQDGGKGRFPGCLPLNGLTAARDAA